MHKTLYRSLLLLVILPLIVSCETLNHQAATQKNNELFFTYYLPKSTPEANAPLNAMFVVTPVEW